MPQLLECEGSEEFLIRIDELYGLDAARFPDAHLVMRQLDQDHLEALISSDPHQWPPVLVTRTDIGYVLIDGYHRKSAAKFKGMVEVRAICKAFKMEMQVIEAAFEANMKHGLPSSKESRSKYAYWLSKSYPEMKQEEIGQRTGITQSAVSKAIDRYTRAEKKAAAAAKKAQPVAEPAMPLPAEQQPATRGPEEQQYQQRRERVRKSCHTLTRDVAQLLNEISALDEPTQRSMILDSLMNIQERENLLKVAHLLEEILEPPKSPRRQPKKTE